MKVKNDYNRTLTNLACSVKKYFGLPIKHQTLSEVDDALAKYHPRNVVVVLYDGMGANIMRRVLGPDDFLVKNTVCDLTTVFPATTTAATTSIRTGLNPVEHGWLGWDMYYAPIDKTITLFMNSLKGDFDNPCQEFIDNKKYLYQDTIVQELNRAGKVDAEELFPFGENCYSDLDEMLDRTIKRTAEPGKHYIYAYDSQPDGMMHDTGCDSTQSQELIIERNQKTEEFASKLHDTLLIVIADHGHINCQHYYLAEYPDVLDCLARTTSLEQRVVSFKIKKGKKTEFKKMFNKYFGKDFKLYTASEVISSGLFGDGEENSLFRPALGDYIALTETDACITGPDDEDLISNHAGYHEDEIFVPLIMKYCE